MEVRANYVLVGIFTLLVVLGGLGFTIWLTKDGKNTAMAEYDIFITDSVTGLSVNNDVLFSGVKVGTVSQIKISETAPGAVRVRIAIAADTPVREDSEAHTAPRGLTGMSVISISGGTANSPLVHIPYGKIGVIAARPSPIASMLEGAPEMISNMNHLLLRAEQVFSDENLHSIERTLSSLAVLSERIAARAESIDALIADAEKTGQSLSRTAARVDRITATMEPALAQLSKEGMTDLRMLLIEARALVQSYTRIGKQLESDPRRFLFGESVKEYHNP